VTPDAVAARSGWGGMTAVRDGRIVAVDDVVITRPGPRLAEGLVALIGAIHPDLLIELPFPSFSLAPIELETDKPTT
jgi:iron complex transport system substrate-binding protein